MSVCAIRNYMTKITHSYKQRPPQRSKVEKHTLLVDSHKCT